MTCSTPGCTSAHHARGLCSVCYRRALRAGILPVATRSANKGKTCCADGCDNPATLKLMCKPHYEQHRRRGITGPLRIGRPPKTKRARREKADDGMPPGWHKPSKTPRREALNPTTERGAVMPLLTDSQAEIDRHAPAVLRLLKRRDALDLAEMLGVAS